VLAIVGKRVPYSLRALLLALAIVDDIGAILVIALLFSERSSWLGLALAAAAVLAVTALQRAGARRPALYGVPCALLWYGLYSAGIHPTLSGVIAGFMTPGGDAGASPRRNLQTLLHPWVTYGIMPLFALANAGVAFRRLPLHSARAALLASGIVLGLLVGKPLGIGGAIAVAVRLRVARLPDSVTWRGVVLVGLAGGIGFTMALFMAQLALGSPELLSAAKLSVLAGSALAALGAIAWGLLSRRA
jgi:NhaA family Na+:H+ antiporter